MPDRGEAVGVDIRPASGPEEGSSSQPEHEGLAEDCKRLQPGLGAGPTTLADTFHESGDVMDEPAHHPAIQDVERCRGLHLLTEDEAGPGSALRPDDGLEEVIERREDGLR